ncbi:MAG TPA: hypothetical protein VMY41_01490 [Thermohalobaculum sp.]|nr:hypothetical protein [Thermohalobaculum sp.]
MKNLTKFFDDDSGAVTIDWVTLSAGILVVGIFTVYSIYNNGVGSVVENVNSNALDVFVNAEIGTVVNQNQ